MLRVVQWATGASGHHALAGLIDHPDLEVVGVLVYGDDKAGRDAGELCGVEPIGVAATKDRDEILGLGADCVVYMAQGEMDPMGALDDICALLAAGSNVVSTAVTALIYPAAMGPKVVSMLEEACAEGGTTFHATGIEPGWASEVLPLTMSGLFRSIDSLVVQELLDYSSYPSRDMLVDIMGFGLPPDADVLGADPALLGGTFRAPLMLVADGLGATIDDFVFDRQVEVADRAFEVAAGRIEPGTVAAMRFSATAIIEGRPALTVEHVTRLAPDVALDWPTGRGWRVTVEGVPSMVLEAQVAVHGEDENDQGCLGTAMHAVHAVVPVCAAPPGIATFLDLPTIMGRHVLRHGHAGGGPVSPQPDLLDGRWYAGQPHDDWAWMRRHAPVYWDPQSQVWALTRHADVLAVEKDPKTFSSHRAPRPHGMHLPMIISMDGEEHTRRRKLVSRGFTPRRVRDHEQTIRRICAGIIDRVAPQGECDFVWDIAAPLPLLMIADMLGFPPESYDDLLRWSDDLIRGTTNDDPAAMEVAAEAMLAFRALQMEVIADRRAKPPQDDLISILCHAEIDGERLDDESITQESLLILIGGDETTRHVLTDGMLALLAHPDQLAIARDDPTAMETCVEELLRWVSPIKNMSRTVTRELELHGQTLHEGDQLILMYPSANRDEAVFDEPDRLDVRRDPNPHLAFGFGPHFCMGASLARLELTVMFSELLRRLPDLHLAGPAEPRRSSNFISGPEAMPVAFTPSGPRLPPPSGMVSG